MNDSAARPDDARDVVLVVDVANVVGSKPDGWWRDRRGASERLLVAVADLADTEVAGPAGERWHVAGVVAVLEGQAREARVPAAVQPLRARGSGDDALAERVTSLQADGVPVVAVTADRGLRARLPSGVPVTGPGWLRRRLSGHADEDRPDGIG